MKLGRQINNLYNEGLSIIEKARNVKEMVKNDAWIDDSTRARRKESIHSDTAEGIKAIREKILDEARHGLDMADRSFKRSIKTDNKTLAELGSSMGAILATMNNDELLTLYENRFDNKAERCLIENYILAKVDSKSQVTNSSQLENAPDPVRNKLQEIFNRNTDRLSEDERFKLKELKLEQAKTDFAVNAAEALRLEVKHLKGEMASTDPDLLQRRDAINNVKAYVGNGEPFGDK